MGARVLTFTAWGVAAPKGSAKGFAVPVKGQPGKFRAVVTHDNSRTKGWQQTIADAAIRALDEIPFGAAGYGTDPIRLLVVFYLARPKSLGKRVAHHTKKPDLDKLTRAVGDALTGVLWNDDSQVVDLQVRKRYAPPDTAPHAVITVQRAPALD